jgi:hypothetical protein
MEPGQNSARPSYRAGPGFARIVRWRLTYAMLIRLSCGCLHPVSRGLIRISHSARSLASANPPMERLPFGPTRGRTARFEIVDGATRATRVAKLAPGNKIRVEVIGKLRQPRAQYLKVGDRI